VIVINHEVTALAMRRRGNPGTNPHPQPSNPASPPPPR
jgi:hypothetical protein